MAEQHIQRVTSRAVSELVEVSPISESDLDL